MDRAWPPPEIGRTTPPNGFGSRGASIAETLPSAPSGHQFPARMVRISIDPESYDGSLAAIASVIDRGGVVALPTDTLYALAASVRHPSAVERVRRIKGLPDTKPILVLIAAPEQLPELGVELSPVARVLAERFWPGPLTLVCPAAPGLPHALTGGASTVAVRQPGLRVLCDVLQRTGPVTGTSANRTGCPPASTGAAAGMQVGQDVDLVVEGEAPGGLPSTLLDVTGQHRLLREGAIPRLEIDRVLTDLGIAVENRWAPRISLP